MEAELPTRAFCLSSKPLRVSGTQPSVRSIDVLSDLFIPRAAPGYMRSGNGPDFAARAVRKWIAALKLSGRLHRAVQSLEERLTASAIAHPATAHLMFYTKYFLKLAEPS